MVLRVGVIGRTGAGGYGHRLDLAFAAHPDATIVAVADSDEGAVAEKRRELGADGAYVDYRQMLERERLDIVVVAPRHADSHFDMVIESLSRGAHVYCEKPLSQTLAEADAMVELAQRQGVLLANALPFVHEHRYRQLEDLLEQGSIGEIVQIRGVCKWDHRGGGQDFLILGVHFADMLRRLAGDPRSCFAKVSADGRPITGADVRIGQEASGLVAGDRIIASYEFDRRVHGTIESWRLGIEERHRQPYRLEIRGTHGILLVRAPYADHSIWRYPLAEFVPGDESWERIETVPVENYGSYHQRAAVDFLRAIQTGKQPACTGADGRAALEMIHAAYASEIAGAPVALPLIDRAHPLSTLGSARANLAESDRRALHDASRTR